MNKLNLAAAGNGTEQKFDFWFDCLSRLCTRLQIEPYAADTIEGLIDYCHTGPLKMFQDEAVRQRNGGAAREQQAKQNPVIKVIFQGEGTTIFEQDGKREVVSAGECFTYDASRPHLISTSSPTKQVTFDIPEHAPWLDQVDPVGVSDSSAAVGIKQLAYDVVRTTFKEMKGQPPESEDAVAESLLSLLGMLIAQRRSRHAKLAPRQALKEQIKNYIRLHLRDSELSIDQIAVAMNYTKRYLHMAFASEGMTIAKYIWTERLAQCRRELEQARTADTTITDIAYSWGFNSSSHFSRMFKETFGFSPSTFLRQSAARMSRKAADVQDVRMTVASQRN